MRGVFDPCVCDARIRIASDHGLSSRDGPAFAKATAAVAEAWRAKKECEACREKEE